MYETYWQLNEKPFQTASDPRFYYPGPSHQAALLKLRYAVENCRGGALLAGPPGCGKTLMVNLLRQMLGPQFSPLVHLVFPQMSAAELVAYLAGELTGQEPSDRTPGVDESIRRIDRFLAENAAQGRHAIVVVDEAQLCEDPATLETMRLLLNFEPHGQPGLTLLLVGQTGVLPILERTPQLEERLGVKCLLRPFSAEETAAYVDHRLKVAGGHEPIFEPEALAALHQLTHGMPRRINRLCDLALLIGYAEGLRRISAEHLEGVQEELVTVAAD
jgi:type II secretory pathway predicted ATPase ExeA